MPGAVSDMPVPAANPQPTWLRRFQQSVSRGVHPASTAVYLTVTAELLQEANLRFNHFAAPLLKEVAR